MDLFAGTGGFLKGVCPKTTVFGHAIINSWKPYKISAFLDDFSRGFWTPLN